MTSEGFIYWKFVVDGKNDIVIKMSGNDERKRIGRNCEHRKLKHFWKCYY